MKRHLYYLLASLSIAGCSEETLLEQQPVIDPAQPIFEASMETKGNRALLTSGLAIHWKSGDQISIFTASTVNAPYQLTQGEDTPNGTFQAIGTAQSTSTPLPLNGAIYPYDATNKAEATNGGLSFSFSIPATQVYTPGSFDSHAFPMLAVSDNSSLQFRNVGATVMLSLTGSRPIARIELQGKNHEIIAGAGTATLPLGGLPTWTSTSGSQTITLNSPDDKGIQLQSTPTPFHITLAPVVFTQGFKVILTDTQGRRKVLEKRSAQTIARNQILQMPEVLCEFTQSPLKPGKDIAWDFPDQTTVSFSSGQTSTEGTSISIDGAEYSAHLTHAGTESIVATSADEILLNPDCSHMFQHGTLMKEISMDYCNTLQVTNMNSMFRGCQQLTRIGLGQFSTARVTNPSGMAYMFAQTGAATPDGTELILGPEFTIPSADIAQHMFAGAKIRSIHCTAELQQFILDHAHTLDFNPRTGATPTVWFNIHTGEVMPVVQQLSITHSLNHYLIPLLEGHTAGAMIDWGDKQKETYTKEAQHEYTSTGSHTVTIRTSNAESVSFPSVKGIQEIDFSKF